MPRIARVVVPGIPHHITQRGNRRMPTFFCADDYLRYIDLASTWCRRCGVDVWAYCLMPNHSHMIAVPESEHALRRAIAEVHRRYAWEINKREGWSGHLWQYRFASFPMDERHTIAAARYIELNPVRARIVASAADYPWSSAQAHLRGRDDRIVRVAPLIERVENWRAFLGERTEPEMLDLLRKHARSGMPLGDEAFIKRVEEAVRRELVVRRLSPIVDLRGAA